MKIALVGNPNSGKTTIYNALTGRNETVGNRAGVTVESHNAALLTMKMCQVRVIGETLC